MSMVGRAGFVPVPRPLRVVDTTPAMRSAVPVTFPGGELTGGSGRLTFDEYVAARLSVLLRYAAVLTGERELAQDIVQDTLIRAHRRWSRIGALDRPELYVKRMVTREFLSWQRRSARRSALVAANPERPGLAADHADAVADRDDVRSRLAVLPKRQRAVVVLRYYEGLTDVEIADVLGCSPGAARTYHSRAMATLRLAEETVAMTKETR
jgi:RNA polymerase sigma-70 factor (sigma-E family)